MQNVRRSWLSALGFLPLAAGFTAACGDAGPTGRSPLGPGSAAPARIELMAPDAVAPGDTARLAVIAYFEDGTSRDVTTEAIYSSSDTGVLEVIPGRIIAAARGEATIAATYLGICIARLMFAMPAGTFRLTGTVTDAEGAVRDADVVVTSGAGAGLSTRTNASGRYRLYGVAGDTRIEIRKENYATRVENIDVGEHLQLDVEITPGSA